MEQAGDEEADGGGAEPDGHHLQPVLAPVPNQGDGHHRVSIAAATGQHTIDAYVTEILTTAPANGTSPMDIREPLD